MKKVYSIKHSVDNMLINLSIEQGVLGALLVECDAIHEAIQILKADYFYEPVHKIIYNKMLKLHESHGIIDLLTVSNALKGDATFKEFGGTAYLAQLSSMVAGAVNFREHCLLVLQMYVLRKMAELGANLQNRVYQGEDLQDLLSFLNGNVDLVNDLVTLANTGKHIGNAVRKALEEIDERQKGQQTGKLPFIKTGLTGLNRLIGGWKKSELIVLAARPGMGKTALMLHFAKVAAEAGRHVCLYSLEMSDVSLAERLCLSECEVDLEHFRDGCLTEEEYRQVHRAGGKIERLPIHVDDNPVVAMRYIRQDVLKKARKGECDMIMVDYLQLVDVSSSKSNSTRDREIAEVSRQAKIIAKELNVPFILLSQLNRDLEKRTDKEPMLSDLRDSDAIEQDADVVCFVHRPAYYGEETVEIRGQQMSSEGVGLIFVRKQRNGKVGYTSFRHNPAMTQINDCVSYDGA